MSDQNQFYDMQTTLTRLLDVQSKQGSDHSSLVMLSLVNLMGIIDILNKRMQNPASIRACSNSQLDLASLQNLVGPLLNIFAKQGQSDCNTPQPDLSFNQTGQRSDTDVGSDQNSGFEKSNIHSNNQSGGQYAKPRAVVNPLASLLNLIGGGGSQTNLAPLLALLGLGNNNQMNQKMDLSALMNIFSGLLAGISPQTADQKKGNSCINKAESTSVGDSKSDESYEEDKNRIIVKKGG